jgi:hypothetical protein
MWPGQCQLQADRACPLSDRCRHLFKCCYAGPGTALLPSAYTLPFLLLSGPSSPRMQEADGEFFSVERMRQRCPLLFHDLMGDADARAGSLADSSRGAAGRSRRVRDAQPDGASAQPNRAGSGGCAWRLFGDSDDGGGEAPAAAADTAPPQLLHILDAHIHKEWLRNAQLQQGAAAGIASGAQGDHRSSPADESDSDESEMAKGSPEAVRVPCSAVSSMMHGAAACCSTTQSDSRPAVPAGREYLKLVNMCASAGASAARAHAFALPRGGGRRVCGLCNH